MNPLPDRQDLSPRTRKKKKKSDLWDAAVVGAGPAGACAAFALARRDARVVLLEKSALPRYKTCGGGVLARAHRQSPVPIEAAVERVCHRAELNFAGLRLEVERPEPIVFMTMRSALDARLAQAAEQAGAQLLTECAVQSVERGAESVVLHTSRGPVEARFLIAADGANSLTARELGWERLPSLAPALECEIELEQPEFERWAGSARFDLEAVPGGYGWVFPKRRHLSVGVVSMKPGPINLPRWLQRYLESLGLRQVTKIERHGYVIPIGLRSGGLATDRALLAGDAAGTVDAVTAEGISGAMASGRLAGEALLEGQFDPASAGRIYQEKIENKLAGELKSALVLSKWLYERSWLSRMLFRKHGQALAETMTDIVMGRRTYGQVWPRPLNYFRLFWRLTYQPLQC